MSIPVRVNPIVKAHVASAGHIIPAAHPLADECCPVCDKPLTEGPVSLVYVGRFPEDTTSWTAASVAVHDACTDPAPTRGDVNLSHYKQPNGPGWQVVSEVDWPDRKNVGIIAQPEKDRGWVELTPDEAREFAAAVVAAADATEAARVH